MGDRHDDVLELQRLKARYFRYMDTKQWATWRELFTDDMVFYMEDSIVPETTTPITTTGDDFVKFTSESLTSAVTVHHGHMPELEITGDGMATGIWSMFDFVEIPERGIAIHGYGHYHEKYEKGADGKWRIQELRLTRIHVDNVPPTQPVPLSSLLPPGSGLAESVGT